MISTVHQVRFSTTSWSQVRIAADPEKGAAALASMNSFCISYQQPLYAFVRLRGRDRSEAEDLVQMFFKSLIENNLLQKADPESTKLRTFLLRGLKNLMSSERRRQGAKKRGGGREQFSLDGDAMEAFTGRLAAEGVEPDLAFDLGWAMTTLRECVDELQAESSNPEAFKSLRPFLLLEEMSKADIESAASVLSVSKQTVRKQVSRLRRLLRGKLRRRVEATLLFPTKTNVDEELQVLHTCLREAAERSIT